jgi:outer membrane protein assembly factor BamB
MPLALLALGCCCAGDLSAENWPRFHGPGGQGRSSESDLPVKWSASSNVRWKTPLPGPGHSSPVVWEDRIFLSAFRKEASLLSFLGSGGDLVILSIDAPSGRILWEREVSASEIEETHSTNAPASPTPVTDGERVYVYFGSFGLVCFDFTGKKVWEHPLGPFPNEWGSASSPILYRDLLLLNVDTDGEDFLLAVNKHTGKTLWKTSRSDVNRAWPTPAIWSVDGRDEIVISGSGQVKAYDPTSGREIWVADGLTKWVTPTPVTAHGLLYVACNGPGGNLVMALRPGGRGNITNTHVAWRHHQAAPYSSSPVVVGDYIYTVKNGGVMSCLNAKTGELAWRERLPAGGNYYASLVAGNGNIYALNEEGKATVVAAKPQFQVVSSNDLGERTMASPAVSGGRIFIRSDSTLFCIGSPGR